MHPNDTPSLGHPPFTKQSERRNSKVRLKYVAASRSYDSSISFYDGLTHRSWGFSVEEAFASLIRYVQSIGYVYRPIEKQPCLALKLQDPNTLFGPEGRPERRKATASPKVVIDVDARTYEYVDYYPY